MFRSNVYRVNPIFSVVSDGKRQRPHLHSVVSKERQRVGYLMHLCVSAWGVACHLLVLLYLDPTVISTVLTIVLIATQQKRKATLTKKCRIAKKP